MVPRGSKNTYSMKNMLVTPGFCVAFSSEIFMPSKEADRHLSTARVDSNDLTNAIRFYGFSYDWCDINEVVEPVE